MFVFRTYSVILEFRKYLLILSIKFEKANLSHVLALFVMNEEKLRRRERDRAKRAAETEEEREVRLRKRLIELVIERDRGR